MRRALLAGAAGLVVAGPLAGQEAGAPDGADAPASAGAETLNGFALEGLRVPRELVRAGGPGRDDIRGVDLPSFVSPEDATWVTPPNPVLGVAHEGEAHVYPVHLIEWHQVVNDRLGETPIAVVYDPLAGSPIAFRRRVGGRTLSFGVSGLVYNSSALLYDRETESLWAPLLGEAVAGELAGTRIERLTVRQETLATWLSRAPESLVLVRPEPRRIDYRHTPYSAYWVEDRIPFPVSARDERFHAKELVVGVVAGGRARAYLGSILTRAGGSADDRLGDARIEIDYSSELGVFSFDVPDGVEVTEAYWFAWKAFHPDTEIWREPAAPEPAEPDGDAS